MEIIAKLLMKLLTKDDGGLRLWARVVPWFLMTCIAILTLAYAYNLVR